MPITQERMLDLITAGEDCFETWEAVIARGKEEFTKYMDGKLTAEQALDNINTAFYRLVPSFKSTSTLAKERMHFKHASHKNNRSKAKMRGLRQQGYAPASATQGRPVKPRAIRQPVPTEPQLTPAQILANMKNLGDADERTMQPDDVGQLFGENPTPAGSLFDMPAELTPEQMAEDDKVAAEAMAEFHAQQTPMKSGT